MSSGVLKAFQKSILSIEVSRLGVQPLVDC
jgi:hypothetical protein